MTADKTSPASIPPAKKIKKKINMKIYHLTKSIYSSVVRNSFSCLIVLLAVVWSPELGLYIFLFGWCVCWFVFLSCWSVSGRFGSGRKRGGSLTRVENRKQVWVGSKTGRRFGSGWKQEGGCTVVLMPPYGRYVLWRNVIQWPIISRDLSSNTRLGTG